MSDMTYRVSVGAAVAADPSIFNLSAVSADAVLGTDQGEVLAGDVTTMHRLRVIDGGLGPGRDLGHRDSVVSSNRRLSGWQYRPCRVPARGA